MKAPRCSIVLVLALFTIGARAEIVTFYFAGNVSSIYNPFGLVNPSLIKVGDPVQASIQFDTTTPDSIYADDATQGTFIGPGWMKAKINGLDFERTTDVQIDILHGANGGQELFQALALGGATAWPAALPTFDSPRIFMAFWETQPPYDLLSNAELPVSMDFSRADMIEAFVGASSLNLNMYEIRFDLLHQVPEPGSAVLLGVGLLLLATRRFSRISG
jgi:PEP-CTERM motif